MCNNSYYSLEDDPRVAYQGVKRVYGSQMAEAVCLPSSTKGGEERNHTPAPKEEEPKLEAAQTR